MSADELREKIARALWAEDGLEGHGVTVAEYMRLADAVLPTVEAEVRKAKAEALREAAEELFYDEDYDVEARGYHQLHDRADRIETGDNDEY